MNITASEILSFLCDEKSEHNFFGNESLELHGFCPISDTKPGCITWIRSMEKFDLTTAGLSEDLLIITDKSPDDSIKNGFNLIITNDPKAVYFEILKRFFPPAQAIPGISPKSVIETEKIGENVSIGHNCYICKDTIIGDNAVIMHNVVIECPTVIGDDCYIGSGTVIGTIGYGYYTVGDKRPRKVPDYGGVKIGNRVSIGANTCIAKGTLTDTVIEDDVKIDNLCHIAHNSRIGARSYIIALSMIAGSSIVKDDVYIAPGAMIFDNITIGENSKVGMGAIVAQSVEPNKIIVSAPARVIKENT